MEDTIQNLKKSHLDNNPHSAQANLNKALKPSSHAARLQQLNAAANERAALRKERAIRKRQKKCQEKAMAAKNKASSKKKVKDTSASDSSASDSEASVSSSDSESEKKMKAKTTKSSNKKRDKLQQNTYAILASEHTPKTKNKPGLSRATRKRQKKLSRTNQTFFAQKLSSRCRQMLWKSYLNKLRLGFDICA